jgi:hypothetical protein
LRLNFISNRESKLKGNRDRKMRLKEVWKNLMNEICR